jgi:hypothetical protein
VNAKPLWKYIEEREHIRLRKLGGQAAPWTKDKILQTYKFTNVQRVHDRTTQAFLKVYQKYSEAPLHVALYNCALRRFTGTVAASDALGWLGAHSTARIKRAEEECERAGKTFWTGAYMIRGGDAGVRKYKVVGDEYLAPLWDRAEDIVSTIEATNTWEAGFNVMQEVHGFGGAGFMAKEVLQDYLLWRRHPVKDAETWTPTGPGARRGLNRLRKAPLTKGIRTDEGVVLIRALLEKIQPRWLETFPGGGRLTAHDIQFCLCELDKYERVRLGEGRPRSKYQPPKEE